MEQNIIKELLKDGNENLFSLIEKLSNNNKEVYKTLSFQKLDLDTFYNLVSNLPNKLGYENIAILDNFMELFAISLQELEEKKDVFYKEIFEGLQNIFIEISKNLSIHLDQYYEEIYNYSIENECEYLPIIKHEKIKINNYKTNPIIREKHEFNENIHKAHISEISAFIRDKVELAEQSQNKIFIDDNISITIHDGIVNITFEDKNFKNVGLKKLVRQIDHDFHFKSYTEININLDNCIIGSKKVFDKKAIFGGNWGYFPHEFSKSFNIKGKTFMHLSNSKLEDIDLTSYSVEDILSLQDEGIINPDSNFNGCKVNIDFINNLAKYNLNNLDISKISIKDLENLDLKDIQISNTKISQEQFIKILNLEEGETFLGRTKGDFSGFNLSGIDLRNINNLNEIIVNENTSLENVQINRNIVETILNLPNNQIFLGRRKGDLHGFNLCGINLVGLDFTNANLENADLRYIYTNNTTIFNNTNLNNAKIDNGNVKKIFALRRDETYLGRSRGDIHDFTIYHYRNTWDICFDANKMEYSNLNGINLRGIDTNTGIFTYNSNYCYYNAKIDEKQVKKILNLCEIDAYLSKKRGDLHEFDLSELNLRDFDFSNANLYRVNLCGADLRRTNLLGTKHLDTVTFDENTILTDVILGKKEIESILSNERNLGLKNIIVPCIMAYIKELGKNEERLNKADFIVKNYKNKFEILEQDKVLDTTNSILNTKNLDDVIAELENCFGIKSLNMQK